MLALYRVYIMHSIYTHVGARSLRILYLCVQIISAKYTKNFRILRSFRYIPLPKLCRRWCRNGRR